MAITQHLAQSAGKPVHAQSPIPVAACCDVLEDSGAVSSTLEAIAVCHQLGFDAVELSLPHVLQSPASLHDIRVRCQELGLNIYGIHNTLPNDFTIFDDQGRIRPQLHDHLQRALETAVALGAPVVTVGIGPSRRLPAGRTSDWAAMHYTEALRTPLEAFAKHEVCLSPEIISSRTAGFFTSAQKTRPWLEQIASPWLGMTCDTFQSLQEGVDVITDIQYALPQLCHLHLAETERQPPGKGTIDFVQLFRMLRQGGYQRTVSVELKLPSASFKGTLDPVDDLRFGLAHVRQCLERTQADIQPTPSS